MTPLPHSISNGDLYSFISESNRIEGITGGITPGTLDLYHEILTNHSLSPWQLEYFVAQIQPGACIREIGVGVSVSNHDAPPGGPMIKSALEELLNGILTRHVIYNYHTFLWLHPFTDGNGRTARLIWLWQMLRQGPESDIQLLHTRGFLSLYHYQSLELLDTLLEQGFEAQG